MGPARLDRLQAGAVTPGAERVLSATGYLSADGNASEGMVLPADLKGSVGDAARLGALMSQDSGRLGADAVFRVGTSPTIIFMSSDTVTGAEAEWHRIAWNSGVAPLLWVTTPQYVRLYNAYEPPEAYGGRTPLLREFGLADLLGTSLAEVAEVCGRSHVAMGSFWRSPLARTIDRRRRIDGVLLAELSSVLRSLVEGGVPTALAQKLVGRCIFFQYLVHRGNVLEDELARRYGRRRLHQILSDLDATYGVFTWIKATFNGDLFPIEDAGTERAQLGHDATRLAPLADFFGHFDTANRQGRLFPFRFDVIPIELISSIYEKFVHLSETDGAPRQGVHYTPINLVDLVLDPLFEGLAPTARVLDPACGSGVFLVESLRRLVWLQTGPGIPTRERVRSTLMTQLRGVDVSPAALSVAAFSLYLALLELDPDPPRGMDQMDCLRFERLTDRVLHRASAFDPGLAGRMAAVDGGESRFDVIVGNPPWTYSPDDRARDRVLAKERPIEDEDGDADEDGVDDAGPHVEEDALPVALERTEDPRMRSGTTYVRKMGLPVPHRSPDWPFVWRCRDFSHPETRTALVLKATPFFSLDPATSAARDAVLRAFPRVTLLNMSQLRTSRLFQEFAPEGGAGQAVKAAGPALVLFSNCLPTEPGSLTAINLPWTSDFRRTGVFQLSAEPPKVVGIDALREAPALLKASMFGTDRDIWFLERLARNPATARLGDWCQSNNLPIGQGYQNGATMASAHLKGLPRVVADDLAGGRLPAELPPFDEETVHRTRNPAIYRGPLVLLPEGRLTTAPALGRYTAAYDERSLAFNRSFVGVSFRGKPRALGRAFAAVMHSALVAHQVALLGGTVGIKQTKVEAIDLDRVRVPMLDRLGTQALRRLAEAGDAIRSGDEDLIGGAIADVDRWVADFLGLNLTDRELLADAGRRAGAILFDTASARGAMQAEPDGPEMLGYARNLCSTFNAFATGDEDLILVPERYAALHRDLLVVRFALSERGRAGVGAFEKAGVDELGPDPLRQLGMHDPPSVQSARSLRLYVDQCVYIVKPAQYRYFSPAEGQSDGDRIIADLMASEPPWKARAED